MRLQVQPAREFRNEAMVKVNRNLFIGAATAIGAWLIVYFVFVQGNWAAAAQLRAQAEQGREGWLKNFKNGTPKQQAEEELKKYNARVQDSFKELKKMEFAGAESLREYSIETVGRDDPKNYLDTIRKR